MHAYNMNVPLSQIKDNLEPMSSYLDLKNTWLDWYTNRLVDLRKKWQIQKKNLKYSKLCIKKKDGYLQHLQKEYLF